MKVQALVIYLFLLIAVPLEAWPQTAAQMTTPKDASAKPTISPVRSCARQTAEKRIADPFGSPAFGVIAGNSVAPWLIQFGLKYVS